MAFHGFDLEVEVTDSNYLAHLVSGVEFGTTAFDVWLEREPALPVQFEAHETWHAQALERRLDGLIESLLTNELIELRPGKRPALLK